MRSIELFAGAGGLGIGVANAGFEHAAVVEWDRWACDTLAENMPWPVRQADVRDVSYEALGQIDLVSGGPPCQPFSLGGKHNANLDGRDMFPQAIRAVRELRPKAFVFENVKGLTRDTFENYLSYIRLQLRHPEVTARPDEAWIDHLGRLEKHETSGSRAGLHYNVVHRLLNAASHNESPLLIPAWVRVGGDRRPRGAPRLRNGGAGQSGEGSGVVPGRHPAELWCGRRRRGCRRHARGNHHAAPACDQSQRETHRRKGLLTGSVQIDRQRYLISR